MTSLASASYFGLFPLTAKKQTNNLSNYHAMKIKHVIVFFCTQLNPHIKYKLDRSQRAYIKTKINPFILSRQFLIFLCCI